MDYGIALDRLAPGAKYRSYATYAEVVATWEDALPVPTDAALRAAYAAYVTETTATQGEDTAIKSAAQTALLDLDVLISNLGLVTFTAMNPAQKTETLRAGLLLLARAIKFIARKFL